MDLYKEDARIIKHTFRPRQSVDAKHTSQYSPTEKELTAQDAKKFEATVQMQLRDLFATV